MQRIVNEAKQDAAKSHVKVRIQLVTMSYYDFLQEYDRPAGPHPREETGPGSSHRLPVPHPEPSRGRARGP